MRITILFFSAIVTLTACTSTKGLQNSTSSNVASGDTRTKEIEFLNDQTYKLSEATDDESYGYSKNNPIKVGGVSEMSGPSNERRFLNGLTGPNGEQIKYERTGSCCGFKTPRGFDNMGMLDMYKVSWEGSNETFTLYFNMYDKGDLKIPVGFKAKN